MTVFKICDADNDFFLEIMYGSDRIDGMQLHSMSEVMIAIEDVVILHRLLKLIKIYTTNNMPDISEHSRFSTWFDYTCGSYYQPKYFYTTIDRVRVRMWLSGKITKTDRTIAYAEKWFGILKPWLSYDTDMNEFLEENVWNM